MKDCKGVELKIGDHVVYIKNKTRNARLDTGKVQKFYMNKGIEECSVDGQSHVTSARIMKW